MMVNQSADLDFIRNLLKFEDFIYPHQLIGNLNSEGRIKKGAIKNGAKLR
jgi:hypothetical protein|tara:strand:+ start:180 stop:329 length:150 start_codon:yes stop_codon:yes gene_type:complete